jgi:hypothetical protein
VGDFGLDLTDIIVAGFKVNQLDGDDLLCFVVGALD